MGTVRVGDLVVKAHGKVLPVANNGRTTSALLSTSRIMVEPEVSRPSCHKSNGSPEEAA